MENRDNDEELLSRVERVPFMEMLGIKLVKVSLNGAELVLDPVRDEETNPYGMIHGGVLYTISDSCAGITARADNRRYVTQCADFHYLSSGKAGERLTARSRVIKRGRSSCIVEVTTFDAAGRQLTLGVFTMFCLGEKKQGTPLQ